MLTRNDMIFISGLAQSVAGALYPSWSLLITGALCMAIAMLCASPSTSDAK